jgi:GTP cyclohydrolase I
LIRLTQQQIENAATYQAAEILENVVAKKIFIYGIPRGGVPAAYAIAGSVASHGKIKVTDNILEAHALVDDLVDSGHTQKQWQTKYPKPFFALFDKRKIYKGQWLVFPWEQNEQGSFEDNIVRLLQFIGEDPTREGLKETPSRVAKAWQEWCSGYKQHPEDILKTFKDGANGYDEMVVVKDIPFYSHCEHHLAPFFGVATVAYIPKGRIVGLSKINRLVNAFARRLQVQERMTVQIADALQDNLKPLGVGVRLTARHLCCESRGVSQRGHQTVSCVLRGVFRSKGAARAEFLSL